LLLLLLLLTKNLLGEYSGLGDLLGDVLLYALNEGCGHVAMDDRLDLLNNPRLHSLLNNRLVANDAWVSERHLLVRVPLNHVYFGGIDVTVHNGLDLNNSLSAGGLLDNSGVHVGLNCSWEHLVRGDALLTLVETLLTLLSLVEPLLTLLSLVETLLTLLSLVEPLLTLLSLIEPLLTLLSLVEALLTLLSLVEALLALLSETLLSLVEALLPLLALLSLVEALLP